MFNTDSAGAPVPPAHARHRAASHQAGFTEPARDRGDIRRADVTEDQAPLQYQTYGSNAERTRAGNPRGLWSGRRSRPQRNEVKFIGSSEPLGGLRRPGGLGIHAWTRKRVWRDVPVR